MRQIESPHCVESFDLDLIDIIDYEKLNKFFKTKLNEEYCNNHLEELLYCYQNGLCLGDFVGWTNINIILKRKVSYANFATINAQLCEWDIDAIGLANEVQKDKKYNQKVMGILRDVESGKYI